MGNQTTPDLASNLTGTSGLSDGPGESKRAISSQRYNFWANLKILNQTYGFLWQHLQIPISTINDLLQNERAGYLPMSEFLSCRKNEVMQQILWIVIFSTLHSNYFLARLQTCGFSRVRWYTDIFVLNNFRLLSQTSRDTTGRQTSPKNNLGTKLKNSWSKHVAVWFHVSLTTKAHLSTNLRIRVWSQLAQRILLCELSKILLINVRFFSKNCCAFSHLKEAYFFVRNRHFLKIFLFLQKIEMQLQRRVFVVQTIRTRRWKPYTLLSEIVRPLSMCTHQAHYMHT